MASPTILPANSPLQLLAIRSKTAKLEPVEVIGWRVDDKGATPILFPTLPDEAQLFVSRDGGWRPFDPATGATGDTAVSPAWRGSRK